MADLTGEDARVARAGLRAKRWVLVAALAISVVFIAASTWGIVRDVFGLGIEPIPVAGLTSNERVCAEGIRRLRITMGSRPSGRWTEAESIERICARSTHGLDAWAAFARLRLAREQLQGKWDGDLAPLEDDVTAHLPADLR